MKKELPSRAIAQGKSEEDWPIMDETYEFKFSLYPNDYVVVELKGTPQEGYYRGIDRATGNMNLLAHLHGDQKMAIRIGTRTLKRFEKYQVDYFGSKYMVKKEVRNGLENYRCHKKSKALSKKQAVNT